MPTLRVTLFGKPHIYLADDPLDTLISAKARAIIFYLATNQERTSRELLAGLLWSDMPDSSARGSLRVALSKLRRELGDYLTINRRNIAFANPAAVQVDVVQFEALQVSDPRAAVTLYTAPFLDDFYLRDAPLFDQWAETERQRLHQQAISLLSQLAQNATDGGKITQAISDLRQLLTLEPWREESHRQLMQLLAQDGQRGAALAQYDLCRQALQDKLDAEPAAETTQLYETIKSGHPIGHPQGVPQQEVQSQSQDSSSISVSVAAATSIPPHNLPTPPTSFIGRSEELTRIHTLLTGRLSGRPSGRGCRLLTITGAGGMGKTRLALEAAHQLLPTVEHGLYLIPLVSLPSADLLVSTIAQTVGLTLHGRTDPQEQLTNYLRHKNILLILDNFEHLLEGIDLLLELLTAAPRLKLLVTTREPLAVAEEWVLPLNGLPHDNAHSHQPAADLFTARARRLDLSFDPAAEAADIGRICTLVEGMPLAIELAAAWVRVIPCAAIAAEIERNLDFLATDLGLVPDHQMSLRAVFRYSYSLLSDEVQTLFGRLAVFRGSFTRDAAETVAGASLRTLSTLVDKSLLQKETNGRFRLHPLLQQFGFDLLDPPAQHTIATAYATYYANLVQQHEPFMYEAGDLELLGDIQADLDNIRAVWRWLSQNREQIRLIEQLLPVTSYFLHRRSLFHDGLTLFKQLLHGRGTWSPLIEAQVQIQAAAFACYLGRYDDALQQLNEAIPTVQQADEAPSAASAFYYLGLAHTRTGDYTQAVEQFNNALTLYNALQDEKGRALVLNGLGIVAMTEGRYAEADRYYRQALDIYRTLGYQRGIANLLSNLGSVYGRQGEMHTAQRHYKEAAAIAKPVGEQMVTAVILSNLGSVSRALGRYDAAIQHYQESLAITTEMGEQRWIAANHNGLGLTYLEMGQYGQAAEQLKEGFATASAINALPDALTALNHLGRVAAALHQPQRAARWLIFVVNHPATPAVSHQEAEETLTALSDQLTAAQKEQARTQAQGWSMADVERAVKRWSGR